MDKLQKYLAFNNAIRIYAIEATQLVQEIKENQESSKVVTAALGRLAIGTILVGSLSSEEIKIYTRVDGGGPVGTMYADGDAHGNVRAYATNPQADVPNKPNGKLDVSGVVGRQGDLFVMKDYGMKFVQKTQTELVSGELGEDFAQFFAASEQVPSAVGLGVLTNDTEVELACGFVAQVLPNCPDEVITELEQNIGKIPSILNYIQEHGLDGFVQTLSSNTAKFLEEIPVSYKCSCSKERFIEALYALPITEIQEMVLDDHDEEIVCEYCNKKYLITNDELHTILRDKN